MLIEKIKKEIKAKSYISIQRYMELCLFDPDYGYYIKAPAIGKEGDFITAPEVSQLFGEMIALYIINQSESFLQSDKTIQLVELGGGKGTLTLDILNTISKFPTIFDKLEIVIIDINETLIKKQKKTLAKYLGKIHWKRDLKKLKNLPTIIYANEFFDALPISQFVYDGKIFKEKVVKIENHELVFSETKTKNAEILKIPDHKFKKGDVLEINPDSVAIMHQICNLLEKHKGLFITFDYGYFQSSFIDTLQALKRHEYCLPLDYPGKADLTSYVDFKTLSGATSEYNIQQSCYMTQGDFLTMMGISERAKQLKDKNPQSNIDQDVARLTEKNQMGEIFKCFIVENLT